MSEDYRSGIASMAALGWTIVEADRPWPVPDRILARYGWVPAPHWEFVRGMDLITSADEKAWLLTGRDFCGESESAFVWDEWERQSLEVADTEIEWSNEIRGFWDAHLPLAICVRTGYRYLALRRDDLSVAVGEEPEFEEVCRVADSLGELFRMLAARHAALASWV